MKDKYGSLPGPYDEDTVAAHQHYLNNIMGSMLCYWEILDDAINVSQRLGEEELVGDFKLKDFSKQMRSLLEDYKSFMDYAKNNIKMERKTLLWLDDIRNPFLNHEGKVPANENDNPYNIVWVLNFEQFTEYIIRCGLPDVISFDHDLGEGKTGMDCAKWLVEYCLDNEISCPKFYVHSANPVGADNISGLLNNFKNFYYVD